MHALTGNGPGSHSLNLPHSEELAKAVEEIIAAAKKESSMLIRTGGTLASDLAWSRLRKRKSGSC